LASGARSRPVKSNRTFKSDDITRGPPPPQSAPLFWRQRPIRQDRRYPLTGVNKHARTPTTGGCQFAAQSLRIGRRKPITLGLPCQLQKNASGQSRPGAFGRSMLVEKDRLDSGPARRKSNFKPASGPDSGPNEGAGVFCHECGSRIYHEPKVRRGTWARPQNPAILMGPRRLAPTQATSSG